MAGKTNACKMSDALDEYGQAIVRPFLAILLKLSQLSANGKVNIGAAMQYMYEERNGFRPKGARPGNKATPETYEKRLERTNDRRKYLKDHPGATYHELADALGLSPEMARDWMKAERKRIERLRRKQDGTQLEG